MSNDHQNQFLENILHTLAKNGYPDKQVALPLERMYEIAYEKQLNFNKVLDALLARGVAHEKTETRVIFFPQPAAQPATTSSDDTRPDTATLIQQAQEMIKGMSPEQLRQVEDMYRNMSDDDRAEMMRKAKEMGLL